MKTINKIILLSLIIGLLLLTGISHIHAADPKDTTMNIIIYTQYMPFESSSEYKIYITIGKNPEFLWKEGCVEPGEKFAVTQKLSYTVTKVRIYCNVTEFSLWHNEHRTWTDYINFIDPNGQEWLYYVKECEANFYLYQDHFQHRNGNGFFDWGWAKGYVTPMKKKGGGKI